MKPYSASPAILIFERDARHHQQQQRKQRQQ
jgi:hypothetical protein